MSYDGYSIEEQFENLSYIIEKYLEQRNNTDIFLYTQQISLLLT
jgi:hypothetical protein